MKIRIVIIGAGFGGVAVLRYLRMYHRQLELTVIDKSQFFSFLPALPDVLGRKVNPDDLSYPISKIARECNAIYVNAAVREIDLIQRKVITETNEILYDYLIIASGSETNFYGNDLLREHACALDDVSDARRLRALLDSNEHSSYLIAGGGYTGIEIATNIRRYLKRRRLSSRVLIVEKAESILAAMPEWMQRYAQDNLTTMQIPVMCRSEISGVVDKTVTLATGERFENALLVWAAGVKTADFLFSVPVDQGPQGRVKVDPYLRINEQCFVIGDVALVPYKNGYLRMGVQFAIAQGLLTARNIVRSIQGQALFSYRPRDLGYVVPMANNCSCGRALSVDVYGAPATLLHYLLCIYRSYGMKNKWGMLKGIL